MRRALAGDRCEQGMRDIGKRAGTGEVERMDCVHTPHTCQWLVVCGLRWMEGGRGVMKGGSVLNSARNCVKGQCASFEPSGERDCL